MTHDQTATRAMPVRPRPEAPHPQAQHPQNPAPMPQGPVDAVAEAIDLVKVYGEGENQVVALNRVNVRFQRGSFTAIMGPSGSGKSTLMHCLAGLDRITDGRVILGGQELQSMMDAQLTRVRRDRIGFIFQSFNLLPTLTAEQNIVLPLDLAGKKADRAYLAQLADSLGLADRLTHRPSELSGGQQQRVAIARALITRPEVIFADEPTGALDTRTGTRLLEFLQQSSRVHGQSIIMVTHDPKAAAYADRALVLVDGRIVDDIQRPTVDSVNAAMARLEA
nr:ABC transporter ATP-binding protein [Aestuariimicrobium sp. p3-SID1156]